MLTEVLVSIGTVVLLGGATTTLAGRAAYRRLRRSRAIALSALRTRAALSLGSRRRVLKLRVYLAESVMSARAALDLAAAGATASGDLPGLFARIEGAAGVVDDQLRLLETETDRAALASALRTAAFRVTQVCAMVGSLRSAVGEGLGHVDEGTLADLAAEVEREKVALAAGAEQLRSLGGRARSSGATPPTEHIAATPPTGHPAATPPTGHPAAATRGTRTPTQTTTQGTRR